MRPFIAALLLSVTMPVLGSSQIDGWVEVLNVYKASAPFTDSLTQQQYSGAVAIYHDTCIAFGMNRMIYNPVDGTYRYDAVVYESRDRGVTVKRIGQFTTWQWSNGPEAVNVQNVYYLPSGNIIVRSGEHCLRYQHATATWKEVWSTAPYQFRETGLHIPTFGTKDVVLGMLVAGAVGGVADEHSDTLMPIDVNQNYGVTPSNIMFGYGTRRMLFDSADDIRANCSTRESSPIPCIWSPALGVAFTGSLMADNNCQQWESMYTPGKIGSSTPLSAITQNGTLMRFSLNNDNSIIYVSSDLGQQWDTILVPSDTLHDPISTIPNVGGRNVFVRQYASGSVKMAVCSTMSVGVRWPRDSATDRLRVQTLICPERLTGDIEVEVDDQEDFTSPLDHSVTAERYHTVRDLQPRTTYWWRYRYRPAADAAWQAWSTAYQFSTGACTRWIYRHSAAFQLVNVPGPTYYTRMLDRTLVRINYPVASVFTSTDNGTTWDSVITLPERGTYEFMETPSGKLIGNSGSRWFTLDLHTGTLTWILNGYYSMQVFGARLIAYTPDSACTSTDEGATWKRVPTLKRRIWSVYADVDGSVLLGCTDPIVTNADTSKAYQMYGLFRYSPLTDSTTQISSMKLPYNMGRANAIDYVRRHADGKLYAYRAAGSRLAVFRSDDNGSTWANINAPFLHGDSLTDAPPRAFITDRDQLPVVITSDNQHRRLYQGRWEIIDDGFQVRGAANRMQDRSYRKLPDGTWCYTEGDHHWMCVEDPSIDQVKPRVNTIFQPQDNITLQWNATEGATYYSVEIQPGDRIYQTTSAAAMFTVPQTGPGRYTWRTRAHRSDGISPWTNPSVFSIAGASTSVHDTPTDASPQRAGIIMSREAFRHHLHTIDPWPSITDMCGRPIHDWDNGAFPALLFLRSEALQEIVIVQD